MKYKIVLFILLFSIIANAQKIMVFDIDSSNLPIISANYLLFDSEDKLIEDVNRSDFQIQLGTENLKIKRLIAPQRSTKVHKISIVLTVDVSGSMSGTNLELAKQAAITFIKMTPLYSCEIAITTFDDGNYINMDFTKNKDRLYNAVGKIRPMGGTDYDEGLLRGPGGALDVLDNAQYDQKIVIFLTDGLGTGSKNDIIIQAKRKDAKIYPITVNMPMPPILSDIADGTYAEYFENLTDITDAENAYIKILSTIMFTKFGQIQWLIEPVCRSRNTNMTLIYKDFKFFIPFKFSEKMLISLNSNNDLVDFGDVEVGDTAVIKVVYTAKNESFEIKEISNKHSDIFHIISPNTIPFVIPQGRSVELKVLYTPKDSVFISDKISFVTNKCNARPVLLYGGLPSKDPYDSNLDLIFPNGGEKLGIASFSKVEWEGVSVFDSIRVSLSVDSGKTYKNIGVGSNLDLSYVVPSKKSDYCLMRISHKMLSYLQYEIPLTMSAKNAQFLEDDKTVFVYGNYYVGTMNIQKGRFNSFYKSKTYMNIVCLGPEEKYFIDADRERITIRNVNDFRIQQEIKPFKLFGIRFTKLHKKYIKDVCFSSDGKYIVSIAADGEMKLWDVRKGKKIVKVKTGVRYVERIEIAPDTNLLLVIARKNLYIFNSRTLELVKKIETAKTIADVCFYENSNKLMIVQKNGIIQSYDTNTWTDVFEHNMPYDKIYEISLEQSEERIAVLHDKGVSIFVFPDFIHQFDIEYDYRIKKIDFSNDGMQIITPIGRKIPVWSTYKRAEQIDISDDFFSIEGGLPDAKHVVMQPSFVSYTTSKYVMDFLENPNPYDVEVTEIKFEGADALKFGIVSGFPPFNIPPYGKKNVEFSYNSKVPGMDKAEILIICHSDTIRRTITGYAKLVPFKLTNKYIDFGTLKKDEKKRKRTSVLRNISSKPLKIVDVYEIGGDEGQFHLNSILKGKVIMPNKELFLDATYFATVPRRSTKAFKLYFEGVQQAITISMKGNCYVPRFVVLSGTVTDMLTTKPVDDATVRIFDINADKYTGAVKVKPNGKYGIRLSMDRKFKVVASASGYTLKSEVVDLTVFTSVNKMKKDFQLEPDFSQTDIVVMNLLFDTDKYSLISDKKQKMSGLITYLKKVKDLKIEISGHTDNEGDEAHNMTLSKNRANSVKNYMVSRGISSYRITTNGFGAKQPVSENDSDEGRQENRRVEIKFVE